MNRKAVAKRLLRLARELTSKPKTWDDYTERHFQRWLDHTVLDDDRDEVEKSIRDLVEEDPDLMLGAGHSWPDLRRMAERHLH